MNPIITDHFMNPRNVGTLEVCDFSIRVGTPVCSDAVEIDVQLGSKTDIDEVRYRAYGCSASLATVSILSEFIKHKSAIMLAEVSSKDIAALLGELAPRERHCRGFAYQIVQTITQALQHRSGS
jgi:nitrogen fixation NifU-like protein